MTGLPKNREVVEIAPRHAPGMRVDVDRGHNAKRTNVQLWTRNDSPAQKFIAHAVAGGFFVFEPVCAPGMAIDNRGHAKAQCFLWEIHALKNDNTHFKLEPTDGGYSAVIARTHGGHRWDVDGASRDNGAKLLTWTHDAGSTANHREFKFIPVGSSTIPPSVSGSTPCPHKLLPQEQALAYCHLKYRNYLAPLRRTVVNFEAQYDAEDIMGLLNTAPRSEAKGSFLTHAHSEDRSHRASVGVSYLLRAHNEDVAMCHLVAAHGNTTVLMNMLASHKEVASVQGPGKCTILYLAARSGYLDMMTALLRSNIGLNVNQQESNGSTSLHVAAFYGNAEVVKLLLEAGADPTVKNQWGSTPLDEARGSEIEDLLNKKAAKVELLCRSLLQAKAVSPFVKVDFQGECIGLFAKRPCETNLVGVLDRTHTTCFHGTKNKYVLSILQNGLKAAGSTLDDGTKVMPPSGHFSLGKEYGGVDDWARAVFVTPNVTYAGHPAYAEMITDQDSVRYRVILVTMVAKNSYKRYSSTVGKYVPMEGEVATPEFRVDLPGDEPSSTEKAMPGESDCGEILRVESEKAVLVVGVLLLRQSFLDNTPSGMNKEKFYDLMRGGGEKLLSKPKISSSATSVKVPVCCICMDTPSQFLFVPCGHQCVCEGCKDILEDSPKKECPVCRQPFTQIVKVFLSGDN